MKSYPILKCLNASFLCQIHNGVTAVTLNQISTNFFSGLLNYSGIAHSAPAVFQYVFTTAVNKQGSSANVTALPFLSGLIVTGKAHYLCIPTL